MHAHLEPFHERHCAEPALQQRGQRRAWAPPPSGVPANVNDQLQMTLLLCPPATQAVIQPLQQLLVHCRQRSIRRGVEPGLVPIAQSMSHVSPS